MSAESLLGRSGRSRGATFRESTRTCVIAGLTAALAACTISQPIQLANDGAGVALFPGGNTGARAGMAIAFADHRPFARPTCERGDPAPECFAGDLGFALAEADRNRLKLVYLAAEVPNGSSLFNTLLLPVSGTIMYRAADGATSSNLLKALLAVGTAYAVMNSGIPDRAKLYLDASRKLMCAMVLSGRWLYTTSEIDDSAYQRGRIGLEVAIDNLDYALQRYAIEQEALLAVLRPRPGTAPPSLNMVERREREAAGLSRGGSAGGDKRDDIRRETLLDLDYARQVLSEARKLSGEIEQSGKSLQVKSARIVDYELHSQLADRAPAPKQPDKALGEIKATLESMRSSLATAEGAVVAPEPAGRDRSGLFRLLGGLNANSQSLVIAFALGPRDRLRRAQQDAQAWLTTDAERKQRTDAAARDLGCEVQPAVVEQPRQGGARNNTARPLTSVTGKTEGTANQPSETDLPPAR